MSGKLRKSVERRGDAAFSFLLLVGGTERFGDSGAEAFCTIRASFFLLLRCGFLFLIRP